MAWPCNPFALRTAAKAKAPHSRIEQVVFLVGLNHAVARGIGDTQQNILPANLVVIQERLVALIDAP
ncbi:unnamed protein product [Fusarium graminearum]|nr:unnamed protein product [Fusarium graminearum]